MRSSKTDSIDFECLGLHGLWLLATQAEGRQDLLAVVAIAIQMSRALILHGKTNGLIVIARALDDYREYVADEQLGHELLVVC